jgi:hypothetical protein
LTGKQPGEQAHGRAGISAIDFFFGRREHTPLPVNDKDVGLGLIDLNAKRAQRVDRMHAIFAGKKTVQRAWPVRESRDNCGAMRNALVARDRNLGFDAGRSLYAEFHGVNLISFAELNAQAAR